MFGYVKPYFEALSSEEQQRYRSVYCGICRSLGERYGMTSRLLVNYDFTFLALVLSSLYEPEESVVTSRCLPHPFKPRVKVLSSAIDYAADLTVALTYFKCLDDWNDEHKRPQKLFVGHLKPHYDGIRAKWPAQCAAIEEGVAQLRAVEKMKSPSLDAAVRCSGLLMSEMFVWKKDFWSGQLRWFGTALGGFIYLMDAVMDCESDRKKGCFNPLLNMNLTPENTRSLLTQPLGDLSEAFEGLPLVQDVSLMRNIIYSGLWQEYNRKMKISMEGTSHDQ